MFLQCQSAHLSVSEAMESMNGMNEAINEMMQRYNPITAGKQKQSIIWLANQTIGSLKQ